MEFTFHSTVIFWIELNCWHKNYSNKATLLLSHRYKNSMVVITIWLTAMKYPYLKWQWIIYFLCRCFLSSITAKISKTWLYIRVTWRLCYKKQELFTLCEHPSSPPFFFVGSVLLIFLVFCVVLLCVFMFWVPCCDVRYDFCIKTMFTSSCL